MVSLVVVVSGWWFGEGDAGDEFVVFGVCVFCGVDSFAFEFIAFLFGHVFEACAYPCVPVVLFCCHGVCLLVGVGELFGDVCVEVGDAVVHASGDLSGLGAVFFAVPSA